MITVFPLPLLNPSLTFLAKNIGKLSKAYMMYIIWDFIK